MKRREDQEQETLDSQMEPTGIPDRAKEFISQVPLTHRSGQNCRIALVSPDDVHAIWESVVPLLEPSQHDQSEFSISDFFELITEGEMHLWVAIEGKEIIACMISQFHTVPQKRVLRIIFISGEGMDRWIENFPMVENFALMNGCTFLEVWGRKAWIKILKAWDWDCKYHIITKDLTSRMH
jgi:hypothetical protein